MVYLLPAEYAEFGLRTDTADAWVVAASAIMDAHCRRASLGAASYTERVRLRDRLTAFMSYGPVVSVTAARARYAPAVGVFDAAPSLSDLVAGAFALPGAWVDVDPATLEVTANTGEIRFGESALGFRFAEVEVTYTAGFAAVPDAVKVACAQIVKNAQATPGLNVRSSRMDSLATEYFSDSLLDVQVCAMLRPYVAERLN